jgi:membrane protease YdiL (CAAX protease family)
MGGIGAAALLWVQFWIRRWKEDFKTLEGVRQRKWMLYFVLAIPMVLVEAPFLEELTFRAPLIVLFGSLSKQAWLGIVLSAAAFAALHFPNSRLVLSEITGTKEDPINGNTEERIREVEAKKRSELLLRKIAGVIAAFVLGVSAGFLGIKYQSLWVSVGFHVLWNLMIPIVLPIVVLLLMLLGLVGAWVWSSVGGLINLEARFHRRSPYWEMKRRSRFETFL